MRRQGFALNHLFASMAAVLALCGCADDAPKAPAEKVPQKLRFSISMDNYEGQKDTRSLIQNTDSLQVACTPESEGGLGKKIGFWVDWVNLDEQSVTKDVLGHDMTLNYSDTRPNKWDYATQNDPLWPNEGNYVVRAFYPNLLYTNVKAEITDANLFTIEYSTHDHQEDLMVATNEVIIDDNLCQGGNPSVAFAFNEAKTGIEVATPTIPDEGIRYGYDKPFNLGDPIPLRFHHTLSALKFYILQDYGGEDNADFLQGIYMQNKYFQKGLATTGMLVYGNQSSSYLTKQDDDLLAKRENMEWVAYPTASEALYDWDMDIDTWTSYSGRTPDHLGLCVRRQVNGTEGEYPDRYTNIEYHAARPYSKYCRDLIIDMKAYLDGRRVPTVRSEEMVFTEPIPLMGEKDNFRAAPLYNENDGYLLVIPQKLNEDEIQMVLKMQHAGVLTVDIPPFTGTNQAGETYDESNLSHDKADFCYLVPGHQYRIFVLIGDMDTQAVIEVDEWENWYSTANIHFGDDD